MANEAQKQELRARVEQRSAALEERIAQLREQTSDTALAEIQSIERHLGEIRAELQRSWEDLEATALDKLNTWLARDPADTPNPSESS